MSKPFVLYGWQLSYFTGKTRCYLRYKGVPHVEKPIDLYTFSVRAKKKTGAAVMPVIVTPQGEWIGDSSVIIDRLEPLFPENPVIPATPCQRLAAYLLEMWFDEWWIPIGMHTRWSYPENYPLFEREAGRDLLPHFPRFLQNRAAAYAANAMRRYQRAVGFIPEQHQILNTWTDETLDHLDRHFATTPFLLGERPSLGDFGLAGPMVGHLGRDPWPKRNLIEPRRHLHAWLGRMTGPTARSGSLLPNDQVPESLNPVFASIFREFLPMLEGVLAETKQHLARRPVNGSVPRSLGFIEFPMGNGRFRRRALPYALWMVQRMLDAHRSMTPPDQAAATAWLESCGGKRLLSLELPRLKLVGLQVAAA